MSNVLSGPNAFFKKETYPQAELAAFQSKKAPAPSYSYETESRLTRIAKDILSCIIFPIGIGRLIHSAVGNLVVPASNQSIFKRLYKQSADDLRKQIAINPESEWKAKRISIKVDGCVIDACILGKEKHLDNGRWTLYSSGNAACYEAAMRLCNQDNHSSDYKQLLEKTESNMLFFNYPKVGSSEAPLSRKTMVKAQHAFMQYLVDKEKGIGAKELICYGESIGGGVQGEAMETASLKNGVKYLLVKDRTFSTISNVVKHGNLFQPTSYVLSFLVWLTGWNLNSQASKRNLKEIIIQTGLERSYEVLKHAEKSTNYLADDGVIAKESSLAYALLSNPKKMRANQTILAVPDRHCEGFMDWNPIAKLINDQLKTS